MKRFYVVLGCALWVGAAGCEAESGESIDGPDAVAHDADDDAAIDARTLTIILERYAGPAFGLKGREVWEAYGDGALRVTEVVPDGIYRVAYGDGILEVVISGGD